MKHVEKHTTLSKNTVFIVDDDLSYLHLLGFNLKKHANCKVYCYTSGEECLKNLFLNPSVIILDHYLNTTKSKAKNGLEILKKIKKINSHAHVIMLSGQNTLQIATNAIFLGAYTYIIKDKHAVASVTRIIDTLWSEPKTNNLY